MSSINKIYIRLATESDVKDIVTIVKRSFVQYCRSIKINTIEALQENELDVLNDMFRKHVYVVYWEQTLVGSIRVEIKDEKATISRFAVLPEYQCLGIGSKMLSFLEQTLAPMKINMVELCSAVENITLKDFYISKGYQIASIDASKGYQRGLFEKKL